MKYVSKSENVEELKEDFKRDINAGFKKGETLHTVNYNGEHENELNEILFINNNYYNLFKRVHGGVYSGNKTQYLYKNNVVAVNIDKLTALNEFCNLQNISTLKYSNLREKAAALFKKCSALKNYNFYNEYVFISSGSVHGFYFPNINGVDCIAFQKYGHYYPIILKVC